MTVANRLEDTGWHDPKLRKGSYFPGFLEPRRMAENALMAVILEAYFQETYSHSVDDLVNAMSRAR
jgi:transposase-like protein